ncbi:dicarboxylate/amino acid:cation symporter [Ignatzschineria rhizosphaerae]|uniref:Dicarboxylate/amino acid:cation symporter n=1 Tax=Ignatzschineria rhizosphaerae TaxID=2923279 RepID=A0ABY3X691_9GAMM|nr:dicarboxylate/amino acid:cation symporter [Ignatzschineria rhizosphaerae]UNM96256.1 dicarboxylate/amino acid:cation symporter [Ignatzschineria rhizosphaerae]
MRKIWYWYKHQSFMLKITAGFILGLIIGLIFGPSSQFLAPLGQIFMNLLKMIVIPLIFLSLMVAVNHSAPQELGRIGMKILPVYLFFTAIAIFLGVAIAKMTNPSVGLTLPSDVSITVPESPSFISTIINMIPTNIVQAMADGNVLSVVFLAIIVGLPVLYMRHSQDQKQQEMGNTLMKFVEAANEVVLKILNGILQYAPIGVLGITASTIGSQGIDTLIALGKFVLTSYIGVILLIVIVYPLALRLYGVPILKFYNNIKEAVMTSFVTSSSLGTLPISINAAKKAGIDERIANLTLPIGATINMNGTALRFGVGVIFAAEIMGIHLGIPEILSIVIIGTLAAVGTAGVPGAGLIGMSIVFTQAGLPIEIVALTAGINALVDMIFTMGNVTGDLVAAKIVDQSEKRLLLKQSATKVTKELASHSN